MLPKRFVFQFSADCHYLADPWRPLAEQLDERYRLPPLDALERGEAGPVEVRAAWNEKGLYCSIYVNGKRQPPWCRTTRPDDSDGVQIWIDTRDVHNVHRAGRFCHRFLFMPMGTGPRLDEPTVLWLPINRAKEHPSTLGIESIRLASKIFSDSYWLDVMIPTQVLTGFDPAEHPRLGFNYAVIDRELGDQTFTVGAPMPYKEDPSLWATLELVRDEGSRK